MTRHPLSRPPAGAPPRPRRPGGLAAALLLPLVALAGCRDDGAAPAAGPPQLEPATPAAWQTARYPYTAAGGALSIYFTRPGTTPDNGEDPEVDDDLAALFDVATTRIDLCLFEFNRPTIIDAALAALARGVTIRFAGDGDELGDEGYVQLLEAGLQLSLRPPNDRIMHNKFVIVDGRWVVTGSMNFSENGVLRNNNNVIVVDSADLAAVYTEEFEQMATFELFGTKKAALPKPGPIDVGNRPVEAWFSPKDDVDLKVRAALASADDAVYFMIFSFTHEGLASDLEGLAAAGVEVVGVFDESQARGRYSVDERLAQAGVPVFIDGNENASGFAGGKLHHKVMIVDPGTDSDPLVITGSYNWSKSATEYNDENVAILRGADLVTPYLEEFCEVLQVAVPHPDFAGALPDPCANLLTPIRINELLPNPVGADAEGEFVEIVNTGSATVQLGGWTLGDAYRPDRHVFAPQELEPGDAVVVWSGAVPEDPERLVASTGQLSLNNNADEISLRDAKGTLIDRVAYEASVEGVSFNRDPDGAPEGAFVLHDALAPGGAVASPDDRVDGVAWDPPPKPSGVVINELLPDPEGTDAGQEYVELVSIQDTPLDVSGWTVEDALAVRHVFPAGTVLPPYSAVVLFDKGAHPLVKHATVSSSGSLSLNNTGDTLTVRDATGLVIDGVVWTETWAGVALNRALDGVREAPLVRHDEVPGAVGAMSPGTRVDAADWETGVVEPVLVLNELLPDPVGGDVGQEYVEIVSLMPVPLDLGGMTLADEYAVRHTFPAGVTLEPGKALVLFDAGEHPEVAGSLTSSGGILSLNNGGDTLTLATALGTVVDQVSWGATEEGVALNRATDADTDAPLVLHPTLSPTGAAGSPGTRADGAPW